MRAKENKLHIHIFIEVAFYLHLGTFNAIAISNVFLMKTFSIRQIDFKLFFGFVKLF